MIYHIQTFCTYGYWPEDLKPKSGKPIIVTCDICDNVRITSKVAYNDLCASCAAKKRYEDPLEHEKTSVAMLKRYEDPLERKKTSKVLKEHYEDPVERERLSINSIRYWDNVSSHEKQSEIMKKRYDDPSEREKQSERMKKCHEDDPTMKMRQSESLKKFYDEMDDPGQQIIRHHYIYDFNDLNKYTIEITRSEHSSLHMKLRQAGLQVPCINILKKDSNETPS